MPLSDTQKKYLSDHVAIATGERPVIRCQHEDSTRHSLLERGLIRYDMPPSLVGRPKTTLLTNAGKRAICEVYAEWIEELMRIECLRPNGFDQSEFTLSKPETVVWCGFGKKMYVPPETVD